MVKRNFLWCHLRLYLTIESLYEIYSNSSLEVEAIGNTTSPFRQTYSSMQLEPVHSMDAVFGATPWEPSYEESHVCPCLQAYPLSKH